MRYHYALDLGSGGSGLMMVQGSYHGSGRRSPGVRAIGSALRRPGQREGHLQRVRALPIFLQNFDYLYCSNISSTTQHRARANAAEPAHKSYHAVGCYITEMK